MVSVRLGVFTSSLSGGGRFVARDIFLDGNTFAESHSVEKHPFRAYGRFGVSARYKSVSIDYLKVYNTEHYEKQGYGLKYGTICLSSLS